MKKFTLLAIAVLMSAIAFAQKPIATGPRPLTGVATAQLQQQNLFNGLSVQKVGAPSAKPGALRAAKKVQGDPSVILSDSDIPSTAETQTYQRSGYFHEKNNGYAQAEQDAVTVIAFDGNDVYIKNPIADYSTAGTWMKGTKDGNTITVPLGQFLAYSSSVGYGLYITLADIDGTTRTNDTEATTITYTINQDGSIAQNGTSANRVLTVAWSDDNTVYSYESAGGEWNTVFTPYVEPDPVKVTPPDGLTTTEMPATANLNASTPISYTVKVGFSGSDVYIQGIDHNLPEDWVKGTLSGSTVTFDIQYIGEYDDTLHYFAGYSGGKLAPVELSYDAADNTLAANGSIIIADNSKSLSFNYFYNGLFIGVPPAQVELPAGVETEDMPLVGRQIVSGSSSWADVEKTIKVGFDGNDVYIQDLFSLVPGAWAKGTIQNNKLVIPMGQYIGKNTNGSPIYAMGYVENVPSDVVFSVNGNKLYISDSYIFENGKKDALGFYAYYAAGLTIGVDEDPALVVLPEGLEPKAYPVTGTVYKSGQSVAYSTTVNVAVDGNDVYIQGLAQYVPEGWIKGVKDADNNVVFTSPQMFGTLTQGGTDYKFYMVGVDPVTEELTDVVMKYDPYFDTYELQNSLLVNGEKYSIYYYSWIEEGTKIGKGAPMAEGTYYFQNVASQKFLAAGDSWGTHAVVNADGLDYIVALTEGKYTLDSKVSNGGNSHFLNGEWNDGAAMGWTIEKTEAGTLTISNGTQFLTAGENSVVTLADDGTAEAAQWIAVTKEERLAAMAAATAEAPVNATFIIEDANFGRNDLRKSAWTATSVGNMSGGNNTNNNAETYHNNFSLSQTLAAAPVGVYALRAQGFYRQDGEDNDHLPVFFANDETQTFPLKTGTENSMSDASASFSAGNYTIDPIYVQVTEAGNLTVGAKLEGNTNLWCIWDNFQLTYYGADADIDVIKNAAIIQELADLRAKALELKDQVEVEAVKNAIDEALAATADVTGTEAINAAIATVKAVIEKANVHIAAKIALTGMENVMAGTNVYTAEAFQTYNGIYETAKGKYEAGELTQADAIENPEAQMGWHAANLVDDLLLSAWTIGETQCKDYDAGMYINTWSVEGNSDGSNFKVPFFEYWVADANSLAENTLTATMNNLPEGKYDVTAWVRVRIKNNAETPATGITLSVNEGEAVNVAAGIQVGTSQMYLKEFTATGEVGADGVLKIQFNVAADNNISWLSFKNVKFEKQQVIEVAHTWDFTKWSDATVANLKADAAASKLEGWSDVEKKVDAEADVEPTEASKDNCFWATIPEGGELTANGVAIEELKGLEFNAAYSAARSLAIAVNYPVALSTYAGPAYLWLGGGGKNVDCFVIKNVKAGTKISMGVESHNTSDARGVQLFVEGAEGARGDKLVAPDGSEVAVPTTYVEQTWAVPAGEGVVNVIVYNTKGCHIYFIDAKIGEDAPAEDPEITVPDGMINLIANGNLATDNVTSFVAKEAPSADILPATIVAGAGKNNSRGIVVKSADEVDKEGAQAWDTQFWINLSEALVSGSKLHVEFDYAASQAAKATTQAHGAPGAYQHWAAIGDVNFTTEWQHFSADITVDDAMAKGDNGNGTGEGLLSIAFNLAEEKSATEYYFDNFGVWYEKPVIPESWTDLIVNGNMDGEENTCFYVTEQGVGGPFVAKLTAGIGKDGSKAVKVQSADDVTDDTHEAQDWDSQFFIRLPYQLPAGTKFKVSFDYKADKAGDFDTQAHANPGQYIHWACCGSGSFTTEWQTYEKEGTVPAECDGSSAQKTFQTIAFNLAKNRVATEFVFDNVKFEVPSDIVSSLTLNPDENPQLYPDDVDGIQTVKVANNGQTIYNLNGQKVNKAQKGLYIINGKKVVLK